MGLISLYVPVKGIMFKTCSQKNRSGIDTVKQVLLKYWDQESTCSDTGSAALIRNTSGLWSDAEDKPEPVVFRWKHFVPDPDPENCLCSFLPQ